MAHTPIFSRAHAQLGAAFFDPVQAAAFPASILRYRNRRWAERVGLDGLTDTEWRDRFGAFTPFPESFETPLALRYHGHQFRVYNPDLGDGRGFLFAQLFDREDGRLLDLGTKGSGKTPWSRGGDGRLTLKGGVREVIATEMLEALGVYTSKSFSLIETGEALHRGDEPSPTRSSVLVRLSHSHIRIGTFQRLDYLSDKTSLAALVDHVIDHYMPDCAAPDLARRAANMLETVAVNVAGVGAQWIAAGFVHGVLNTDNIAVTGESFDYGPWRFLPRYDPGFTAAYFDQTGLYAFGRQPDALAWNLTRLAECLLPLADASLLEPALNVFWPSFQRQLAVAVVRRLGLASLSPDHDAELLQAFLAFLSDSRAPYEQTYFDLFGADPARRRDSPAAAHYRGEAFDALAARLDAYAPRPDIDPGHPYLARPEPTTMVLDDLEALWAPIAERDDWTAFATALADIGRMRDAYGLGTGPGFIDGQSACQDPRIL